MIILIWVLSVIAYLILGIVFLGIVNVIFDGDPLDSTDGLEYMIVFLIVALWPCLLVGAAICGVVWGLGCGLIRGGRVVSGLLGE